MSGGSFDYLYLKEAPEIMQHVIDVEDMRDICLKLGYIDIARDLTRLAEYSRSAYIRIEVLKNQLRGVMRAVEWYESNDIGEESLAEAIEKYRNGDKA